jgi:hypothetical protein
MQRAAAKGQEAEAR